MLLRDLLPGDSFKFNKNADIYGFGNVLGVLKIDRVEDCGDYINIYCNGNINKFIYFEKNFIEENDIIDIIELSEDN